MKDKPKKDRISFAFGSTDFIKIAANAPTNNSQILDGSKKKFALGFEATRYSQRIKLITEIKKSHVYKLSLLRLQSRSNKIGKNR